ncbi:MAG: alpha/beta fold hydrolase [Chloroflexota bacterium]|nr:alpha/beta fold hydrolase [Chloroflexota bacterium]
MEEKSALNTTQLPGEPFFWEAGLVGVLLCHGFTATPFEVRALAEFLHERGYTVSAPLLPGHGTTPEEMNRCRWQDWVAALEDAYRQLAARSERVFIGGESLGGLLALYLATEHSEVAGILTFAPALKIRSRLDRWRVPLLAAFVPFALKPHPPESGENATWQGYTINPLRAARELLRLQRVVRGRLERITQPLLVIQGRQDNSVAPEVPSWLAAETRSAWKEIHWLAPSGHCVLLEGKAAQARELALRFMEAL